MALTQFQGILWHHYQLNVPEDILYSPSTTLDHIYAALCAQSQLEDTDDRPAAIHIGGDTATAFLDNSNHHNHHAHRRHGSGSQSLSGGRHPVTADRHTHRLKPPKLCCGCIAIR
jgi:hypothetical protein